MRNEYLGHMEGKGIEELMLVSIYSFLHVSVDTEKLAYGSNFEIHAFIYNNSIKKKTLPTFFWLMPEILFID